MHLSRLLDYWIESAKIEKSFDKLKEFFLKDQFLATLPSELRVFVKEHKCDSLAEMTSLADTYAEAHNFKFKDVKFQKKVENSGTENGKDFKPDVKCYSCGLSGHRSKGCPQNPKLSNRSFKSNSEGKIQFLWSSATSHLRSFLVGLRSLEPPLNFVPFS